MCGITGLWRGGSATALSLRESLERMSGVLRHRGPDGEGYWVDEPAGIGLGHRRLSILDLSEAGRQPMWSKSGRYCISYNGEVYNAPELREELSGAGVAIEWSGHSDTEVVLEAIAALGLEPALRRFHGMFAFALWDRRERTLALVRDRLGIKPLLYVRGPFGLAFASELRSLLELPDLRARLSRPALTSFLRYGVVPDGNCIVEGVRKVAPGAIVHFDEPSGESRIHRYWSAAEVARRGLQTPFTGSDHDAVEELARRITRSVSLRMRSDVPFGAFLSGGIDSSTVVASMQRVASSPVKTFCIGNAEAGYDESDHAARIARHLGCEHHTLVARSTDMLALVPDIANHWDEPFADSSQVPTYLVSRLTKEHVTVSLSGDGGDELFAGYNRHAWAPRLWALAQRAPASARKILRALTWLPADEWDRVFRRLGLGNAIRLPGDKLYKVAALAQADTPHRLYERLRSIWSSPAEVLLREGDVDDVPLPAMRDFDAPFTEQMMLYDLMEYLPDDILTKVDRASMAVSLEARVPLLDHDLVELAWQLPRTMKIRGRTQKWILRQVLARDVPAALFERPKTGFGVPVGQWIRGPLRPWAAELLDGELLAQQGIFEPAVLTRMWANHVAGKGNDASRLWAVLMFQSWWRLHSGRIES